MKKRILVLVCALALLVGCLVMSSMAVTTKEGYCQSCKANVTWEPVVFGVQKLPAGETSVHKHYYFDKDYSHTTNKQILTTGGVTVCVDLNGKSWYSWGRAFYANYTTQGTDWSTINIQDSVGGAVVTSRAETTGYDSNGKLTGTNNTAGSNIWVAEKCTVNVYGGTFQLDAIESEYGLRVDNGGIAAIRDGGVLNLYGGTFQGGKIKASGSAVHVYNGGTFNAYGGVVRSGISTGNAGNCVSVADATGKVKLAGNAAIDDIFQRFNVPANLTVDGAFTGRANLSYASTVSLAEGTAVGTLTNNGSVADADLYCSRGYSVVAKDGALKLAAPSAEDKRYECPHCKTVVKWEVFSTTAPTAAGSYHYYLNKSYDMTTAKQYSLLAGQKVCLDLNGFSYTTNGRALNISGSATVMSVIDTKGGGSINGSAGDNNPGGGTVSLSAATFNLYGGTMTFTHNPNAKFKGTGRGGIIQNAGTVNVYGGKMIGGELAVSSYGFTGINGAGGAIYNNGTLNIYGGELTSGSVPEIGAGPCVYMAGAASKINLSGNGKVEDIFFSNYNSAQLTVTGTYTGTANLSYDVSIPLTEQMVVGTLASGSNADDASISCEGAFILPTGDKLVLSSYEAGTVAATGGVGYGSLQEAIDAAEENALVELVKSQGGDIAVNKTIYLQLNGCSVTGTVTVAEGKTLYGMDGSTEDFTVADGKYGKLAKVEGNVAAATLDSGLVSDNFMLLTETDGVSFHCVRLQIYAMTLQMDDHEQPALFYKSHFKADEKIAATVKNYGVALSLNGAPTAENLEAQCGYTTIEGFESGAQGNLGAANGTLLTGILKAQNSERVNLRNLNIAVYGRAYVLTNDGQYLFGKTVSRSLAEQLALIDPQVSQLSQVQVTAVTNLYTGFKSVLSQLDLPGIVKAVEEEEKGTLKVLLLGNSHGLDATNLLYEVFHNEAPEQKVVLGVLYHGGCRVDQHKTYLSGNQVQYTYHKNDGTAPNRTWVVRDATCMDALQDEQWDVILMQQMNTNAGQESMYKADDWKFVAEYLLENQSIQPKLGFHVTWANPDNYELFLNDDAPYNIRYIASYADPTSWRNNHERSFPSASGNGKYDMNVMYEKVMQLTQKYLVDSTEWLGADYFDDRYMMASGTAVQYAQKVLGREQLEIYRDYTHVSDYGRLICAYQWYAQLMGLEEITEVNMDSIPVYLKHQNSKYPVATNGVYVVDEQMKADLIASVNWALKNPYSLPTAE